MNWLRSIEGVLALSIACLASFGPTAATAGVLSPGDLIVTSSPGRIFRVDPITGARLLLSADDLLEGRTISGVAVGPDGDLFVASPGFRTNEPGRIVRIDPNTGEQALVASSTQISVPSGITIDPSGNLIVAVSNHRLIVSIDPASGDETVIVHAGVVQYSTMLVFDACGDLITDAEGSVARTDLKTGSQSIISERRRLFPAAIALDKNGDLVVLGDLPGSSDMGELVRMDPFTGESTTIAADRLLDKPIALAIGPDGALFVGAEREGRPSPNSADNLIRLDPETGELIMLTGIHRLKAVAVVPEIKDQADKRREKRRCRVRKNKARRRGGF